jgi:hypothetical protein
MQWTGKCVNARYNGILQGTIPGFILRYWTNQISVTALSVRATIWIGEVFSSSPKTKAHDCHEIVKSTTTHAAETECLEAKTVAKLNSKEIDFWRRLVPYLQERQN